MLSLLFTLAALARPELTILTPVHGGVLDDVGSVAAADLLFVSGRVDYVSDPAGYTVEVGGSVASLVPDPHTPDGWTWSAMVDVAERRNPARPYDTWYLTDRIVFAPVLAELVRGGTVEVRDRILLYDRRLNTDDEPHHLMSDAIVGAGAQLTADGFAALDAAHRDSLPWPNRFALDADLAEVGDGATVAAEHDDACLPMTTWLSDRLPDRWAAALVEANLQYAVYEAAKHTRDTSGNLVAIAVAEGIIANCCVREEALTVDQFEVCVGRTTETSWDLSVAEVVDASISPATDFVAAEVVLGELTGALDVELEDLVIRWADKPSPICTRPKVDIRPEDISADPDLVAWATCEDLPLRASTVASLGPVLFELDTAAGDSGTDEDLLYPQVSTPPFLVDADLAMTGTGTCADIDGFVDDLPGRWSLPLGGIVQDAWALDSPDTDHAAATEALLSPLDHGLWPTAEVAVDAEVFATALTSVAGLSVDFLTRAHEHADLGGVNPAPPTTFFYRPESAPGAPVVADPELVHWVTTGHLNQLLAIRSHESFADGTPEELFGSPRWTGTELGTKIHPAFHDAGVFALLQLVLTPTLAPFTFHPDFGGGDDHTLHLHVGQLEGEFRMLDGTMMVRFMVDLFEPDVRVDVPGDGWLTFRPGLASPRVTLLETNLGCQIGPFGADGWCSADLEDAIGGALEDWFRTEAYGLLTETVPAPTLWDAYGTVDPVIGEDVQIYQDFQVVHVSTELD